MSKPSRAPTSPWPLGHARDHAPVAQRTADYGQPTHRRAVRRVVPGGHAGLIGTLNVRLNRR
jgi:hypothetical protein